MPRRLREQKSRKALKLDATATKVKIAERVVEVCCDECAQKLREARADHQQAAALR
jgi:hypothetical protein